GDVPAADQDVRGRRERRQDEPPRSLGRGAARGRAAAGGRRTRHRRRGRQRRDFTAGRCVREGRRGDGRSGPEPWRASAGCTAGEEVMGLTKKNDRSYYS